MKNKRTESQHRQLLSGSYQILDDTTLARPYTCTSAGGKMKKNGTKKLSKDLNKTIESKIVDINNSSSSLKKKKKRTPSLQFPQKNEIFYRIGSTKASSGQSECSQESCFQPRRADQCIQSNHKSFEIQGNSEPDFFKFQNDLERKFISIDNQILELKRSHKSQENYQPTKNNWILSRTQREDENTTDNYNYQSTFNRILNKQPFFHNHENSLTFSPSKNDHLVTKITQTIQPSQDQPQQILQKHSRAMSTAATQESSQNNYYGSSMSLYSQQNPESSSQLLCPNGSNSLLSQNNNPNSPQILFSNPSCSANQEPMCRSSSTGASISPFNITQNPKSEHTFAASMNQGQQKQQIKLGKPSISQQLEQLKQQSKSVLATEVTPQNNSSFKGTHIGNFKFSSEKPSSSIITMDRFNNKIKQQKSNGDNLQDCLGQRKQNKQIIDQSVEQGNNQIKMRSITSNITNNKPFIQESTQLKLDQRQIPLISTQDMNITASQNVNQSLNQPKKDYSLIHEQKTQEIKTELEFVSNELSIKEKKLAEAKEALEKVKEELYQNRKIAQKESAEFNLRKLEFDDIINQAAVETQKLKLIKEERSKYSEELGQLKNEVFQQRKNVEMWKNQSEQIQITLQKVNQELKSKSEALVIAEKKLTECESRQEECRIVIRQQTESLDAKIQQLSVLQMEIEKERQRAEKAGADAESIRAAGIEIRQQNGLREEQLDLIEKELRVLQAKLETEQTDIERRGSGLDEKQQELNRALEKAFKAKEAAEREREALAEEREHIMNETTRIQEYMERREKLVNDREATAAFQAKVQEEEFELKQQGLELNEQLWQRKVEVEQQSLLSMKGVTTAGLGVSSNSSSSHSNSATQRIRKNGDSSMSNSQSDYCSRNRSVSLFPQSGLKFIPNNNNCNTSNKYSNQEKNYLFNSGDSQGYYNTNDIMFEDMRSVGKKDKFEGVGGGGQESVSKEYRFKKDKQSNANNGSCIKVISSYTSSENGVSEVNSEKNGGAGVKGIKSTSFRNFAKK